MSGLLTGLSPNQAAVFVGANPNGSKTSPIGTIAVGPDGTLYQNTDGGTTWTTGLSSITNAGNFALTGEQTFSTTGTSNDVALSGGVSVFRYTGSGTGTITGFTGGYTGRLLLVTNESPTSNSLTLSAQTGSAAGNQIFGIVASNYQLSVGGGALFRYDGSASKWRVIACSTAIFNTVIGANGGLNAGNTLTASAALVFSSTNSPTSISGTTNDWAPGGGYRYRIAASASAIVTGLSGGGVLGSLKQLQNISSFNVTLTHEGTGSTAANRFACPRNTDLVIPPGASAFIIYDTASSRWVVYPDGACWSQGASTLSGDLISFPWVSGNYYETPCTVGTGTGTFTNNVLRLYPTYIPNAVTLTKIGCEVTTAGEAGSKIRLGIYGDDGTGHPGVLIADGGQIDGTIVGMAEVTISAAVGPGWYWVGGATQSGPTTAPTVRTPSSFVGPPLAYGTSIPSTNQVIIGYSQSSVSAGLPNPFTGSSGISSAPRIFVKT